MFITRYRILIFARAPVPGQCKTRLIPALGADGAAAMAARLLEHALTQARRSGLGEVILCGHPHGRHPLFQACFATRWTQKGADLGARMEHAIRRAAAPGTGVLLMGSDCPGLTAAVLRRAAWRLKRHDLVLVPAEDGGYVLLGLRRPAPDLFRRMPWGGDGVFRRTLQRARRMGLSTAVLEPLWDLDRPEDLERLHLEYPVIVSE